MSGPLTADQVDDLSVLPILDPIQSTDIFPVQRPGSGIPLEQTTFAQMTGSLGFGTNAFQVTPSADTPMTGASGSITIPFNIRTGGTEPEAFDPFNVFNPTFVAPAPISATIPVFIAPGAGIYRILVQANLSVTTGGTECTALALVLHHYTQTGTLVAEAKAKSIASGTLGALVSMACQAFFDCSLGDFIYATLTYDYGAGGQQMSCLAVQSFMDGFTISLAAVPVTSPDQTVLSQFADFTLNPSMDGALILVADAAVTVDIFANQPFGTGARIDIQASNVTPCTFIAAGGVTINSVGGSLAMAAQWGAASLIQTAQNVWSLVGDLA